MKRGFFRGAWLLLAACLLTGCAALLERSYSVVEPYADRYWDSSAEDTLRAETYQDLVNSMLLLIEQKAEEGVIRCYDEAEEYQQALAARGESEISQVQYIERGYENLVEKLQAVGADIRSVEESDRAELGVG